MKADFLVQRVQHTGMWKWKYVWRCGIAPGNCPHSLNIKRHLIKPWCDEVGDWLGTLIGLEPDIMYQMCLQKNKWWLSCCWVGLFFLACVYIMFWFILADDRFARQVLFSLWTASSAGKTMELRIGCSYHTPSALAHPTSRPRSILAHIRN